jgi:hypothetical protein
VKYSINHSIGEDMKLRIFSTVCLGLTVAIISFSGEKLWAKNINDQNSSSPSVNAVKFQNEIAERNYRLYYPDGIYYRHDEWGNDVYLLLRNGEVYFWNGIEQRWMDSIFRPYGLGAEVFFQMMQKYTLVRRI